MRSSPILPSPRFERTWSVNSAESVDRNTPSSKRDYERSLVALGLSPSPSSSSSPFLQLNRKDQPGRMDTQVEEGQPATAAPRQAVTDDEGNTVTLSLDIKSVKPYRTQDEYLYAMKEDLAEWFNALYDLPITVDDFFEQLETGVVLCQHANALQNFIASQLTDEKGSSGEVQGLCIRNNRYPVQLPFLAVVFRIRVQPGSFQSRDNISNFIAWCRQVLGIPDTLLFETEDLVSRKNERNVVLCVLEVARRGASYGMLAPKLVQFEAEIDAEMAEDEEEEQNDREMKGCNQNQHHQQATPRKQKPWIEVDMMSLDEMVRLILSACTCEHQFPMIRVSEGKYRFGESLSLIFLRILRNHVMVRIGGGWDTLECFLDRYDPCRCKSKEHRGMLAFATKTSTSHATEQQKPLVAASLSHGVSSCPSQHSAVDASSSTQTKDTPSLWNRGSPKKHPSKETLQPEKQSKPRIQEQPHPPLKPKPQSPLHTTKQPDPRTGPVSRRSPSPVPLTIPGDGQPSKSQGTQGNRLNGPVKPSIAKRLDPRPSSASPSLARANKTFRSSGDLLSSSNRNRGNSPTRGQSPSNRQALVRTGSSSTVLDTAKNSATNSGNGIGRMTSSSRPVTPSGSLPRSSSMDSTKLTIPLRQQKPRPATAINSTGQRPLSTATRTKSSPNVIHSKSTNHVENWKATKNNAQLTRVSSHSSGNLTQKLNGLRLGITADKLLPSYSHKWTGDFRSSSLDVSPMDEARVLLGIEDDDDEKHPFRIRRSASLQPSVSFTLLHIDDYPEPVPPEDEDLNARMEMLFEQYRDVELGQMFTVANKTDKKQSDKKSVSGPVSNGKNCATPSSSKVVQGRGRGRVGAETPPSRSLFCREAVEKGNKKRSLRAIGPLAETSSDEKVSRSPYRPASSAERNNRMVSRKESSSWSADHNQPTTKRPGSADHPMRSSFDASLRSSADDARPRSSSRPSNVVSKYRALSGSRENFAVGGSLGRRNSAQGLSKSFGDITDIRLTLQRPFTPNPASRISGMETSCREEKSDQVPLNECKESGNADSLQISLNLAAVGDSVKAKPRKDDRLGPPTRIPLPVAHGDQRHHDHSTGSLKRFDSGVDITNISPTGENGSVQGDEDGSCRGWTISVQCSEACSLSDQKLMFTAPPQVEDEFY